MTYTAETLILALALTTLAGMSTGIGALMAFFAPETDRRFLSLSLGLSGGVMIYVAFMEMLPSAIEGFTLSHSGNPITGKALGVAAFFLGIGISALIDKLIPEDENPHESHTFSELTRNDNHHLRRTGIMLALAIGIHNFPEGIATFISALDETRVALPIVIAIAIHNIPEGMAVAVPIYHSTGSRSKALKFSLLSGLAEPAGALVGMALLLPFWTPQINSWCLAAIAGIMVYISFDELLPGAERYGHHHLAIAGIVAGMLLMAATLIVL